MRIRIQHETVYQYQQPAVGLIQILRLTPRNHDGQYIIDWRVEVSEDCRLAEYEDAFGNITHTFTVDGPVGELRVIVQGEVDTQDTNGIVRNAIERFPASLYLRETSLTKADEAITVFAQEKLSMAGTDELNRLHVLLSSIKEEITYDTNPTHATTTAAEAFALRRGVCQDLTHIFIAAARCLKIPARYVGGYLNRADGVVNQEAGHAWAEAFVQALGWVAFDPANGICATDGYVRVAVGLDYLGAAPVRGTRYGGGTEQLTVAVHVNQAARQTQS
jgi:transglutaminase-like putative cysteine protease